jgi:hypothetical protein
MRAPTVALAGLVLWLATGCATEGEFVPAPPPVRHRLAQWPRGSVTVTVRDARITKADDSPRLVGVVTAIVTQALAAGEAPPSAPQELRVSIVEHGFEEEWPRRIARTRFHVALVEGGRTLQGWVAVGEEQRWSLLPGLDEPEISQQAFDRAIADLMAKLASWPAGTR